MIRYIHAAVIAGLMLLTQRATFYNQNFNGNTTPVGLLDEWPMNEGTGTTLFDGAPTNPTNIPVNSGICTWGSVAGWPPTPCTFLGAVGADATPSSPNYERDGSTPFSACAVWNATSWGLNSAMVSALDGTFGYVGWEMEAIFTGHLYFAIVDSGGNQTSLEQTGTLSTGVLTQSCFTYAGNKNGTGSVLYVDGASVASTITQNAMTGSSLQTRIGIGDRNPTSGSGSAAFVGPVGWVSVWSCQLSPTVISNNWTAISGANPNFFYGLHC